MTDQTTITAADLYARIATAFVSDPALEQEMLADLPGAIERHFGFTLQKPGSLQRTPNGFRLMYDGHNYDLGDPRVVKKGELNDAELELVSAGGDDCPQATMYANSGREKKTRTPIQSNGPS